MKVVLKFILDRGKERSTWVGLIALAAALGVHFDAAQTEAIATAALGLIGLLAAFTKDA